MAIINSLAIGSAKNSLGQITYSTVKGRTIGRQKPVHVANPRTPRQVAQRNKMANLVAAWRTLFFQTRPWWTVIKGYGSAYNEFVSKNMQYGSDVTIEGDIITSIPEGFYISSGKYGETAVSLHYSDNGWLEASVKDLQLRAEINPGDKMGYVLIDPTGQFNNEVRTREITEFDIDTLRQGGKMELDADVDGFYAGVVYYSSARGVSSTGRLELIEGAV